MSLSSLLQRAAHLSLQPAAPPRLTPQQLQADHIAFSGSPLQHPDDENQILLIADPYSQTPLYYAFRAEDVVHVEKLPHLSQEGGAIVPMARLWVKKGSIALKHVPFVVADLTHHSL